MITYDDWKLSSTGELAQQYDHLSRRLEVFGTFPDGWSWDMLVSLDGNLDIISLAPMEGGMGADLTRDQLSMEGMYTLQLRGTSGETVRHTNAVQADVQSSLSGDAQWPTIPTEFTQMEQRVRTANSHPPVPGANGFWMVWNGDTAQYEESQYPLPEGGINGSAGEDGGYYTPSVDESTGTLTFVPSKVDMPEVPSANVRGPQGEQGPAGADGTDGKNGAGMDVTGAAVGQIAQIAAVDENGVPTQWCPADLPSGDSWEKSWRLLKTITLEEDVKSITIDTDDDGIPLDCQELFIHTNATNIADTTSALRLVLRINSKFTTINSSNDALEISCGAYGAAGRSWLHIQAINPLIAYASTFIITNSVTGKDVTTTVHPVGIDGNPFAEGEHIGTVLISANGSANGIAAGSIFELYGR